MFLLTTKSFPKVDTYNMAKQYKTRPAGHRESPEESASNPNPDKLFECLALPPHVPAEEHQHSPPHTTTANEIHAEENALGFGPRIGRRTAAHYGLDREAWQRQAALRM